MGVVNVDKSSAVGQERSERRAVVTKEIRIGAWLLQSSFEQAISSETTRAGASGEQ